VSAELAAVQVSVAGEFEQVRPGESVRELATVAETRAVGAQHSAALSEERRKPIRDATRRSVSRAKLAGLYRARESRARSAPGADRRADRSRENGNRKPISEKHL
jgi:hypothetical protein